MRRKSTGSQTVSLFPFLAVLICMMGALVLLLLGLTQTMRRQAAMQRQAQRQAREYRAALPLASLRPPPVPIPGGFDRAALSDHAAQLECDRQQRWNALLAAARAEQEELAAELRRRKTQRDELTAELEELARRLDSTAGDAGAASVAAEVAEEQQQELEARHARLTEQIALTERKIEEGKLRQTTAPNEYAIVPYDGASGTPRRPIYIECTETGFRFLPEDVFLGVRELKAGTARFNALVTGTQALLRFWTLKHERAPERIPKPYILLLVRPGGIYAYDVARTVLSRFDVPFGYELLEDKIVLQKLPPDPQSVAVLKQAVALAVELGDQNSGGDTPGRREVQTWDEERGQPVDSKKPRPASISGRSRDQRLANPEETAAAPPPEIPDTFHQPTDARTEIATGLGGSGGAGAPSGPGASGPRGMNPRKRPGGARPATILGREPRGPDGTLRSLESAELDEPRDLSDLAGSSPSGKPGEPAGNRGDNSLSESTAAGSDRRLSSGAGSPLSVRAGQQPGPSSAKNPGTALKEPQYGAPAAPGAESAGTPGSDDDRVSGAPSGSLPGQAPGRSSKDRSTNGKSAVQSASARGDNGDEESATAPATDESIESLLREEVAGAQPAGGSPGLPGGRRTNERAPIHKPENPAGIAGGTGGSPDFSGGGRRGGGPSNRNLIGLERKIPIRVERDRVLVGDEEPIVIQVKKGPKASELVPQVTAAMGRVVDSWGPAPEKFYWIPGVRFEVTTDGNAVYERLRGALTRQKVNSTVDYVDTPGASRRGGGR